MQPSRRRFLTNILILSGLAGLHFYVKRIITPRGADKKRSAIDQVKRAAIPSSLNPGFYVNNRKLYYVSSKFKLSDTQGMRREQVQGLEKKLKALNEQEVLSAKKYDDQITEWMAEDYACLKWNRGNRDITVHMLTKILNKLKKNLEEKTEPRILFLAAGFFSRYESLNKSFEGIEQYRLLWDEMLAAKINWKVSVDSWKLSERGIRWQKTQIADKKITWHKYTLD